MRFEYVINWFSISPPEKKLEGLRLRSVLAKFYTGKDLLRLKRIYDKAAFASFFDTVTVTGF